MGEDHQPQHGFTDFWRTYHYIDNDYTDPLSDYFKQNDVPNLYSSDAEGMTLCGNTLRFGTIAAPRQQRTTWTVAGCIEFIQQKDEGPLFLFASIKDPHPLILVPPKLLVLYSEEQMPLSPSFRYPRDGTSEFQTKEGFRIQPAVTDAQFRRLTAYYYALISHIDHQIWRLICVLRGTEPTKQYGCVFR